jgi:hypothetical protein
LVVLVAELLGFWVAEFLGCFLLAEVFGSPRQLGNPKTQQP